MKSAGGVCEGFKKRIRDLRQEAMEACKAHVTDKDVRRRNELELQKAIQGLTVKLEQILAEKQKQFINQ